MKPHLEGKVAVVTGGGSGIGRATAQAFAREGAKLVIADVAVAGGEETAKLIRANGGEATFVRTDVTRADQVEALIQAAVATYGRLDCAHNNAGIEGARSRADDCTEENWDRVIEVNLKGVWLCMKYEIAQMRRQGTGAIVNTSSIAGLVGLRKQAAYAASKHAVLGLTKTAALEYAGAGLRINAVCPGAIDTEMLERIIDTTSGPQDVSSNPGPLLRVRRAAEKFAVRHYLKSLAPMKRMGASAEVAEAVIWLCSDAASFVTGHALVVDGGYLTL